MEGKKSAKIAEKDSENFKPLIEQEFPYQIIWKNVFFHVFVHICSIYGLFCAMFYAKWQTLIAALILHIYGEIGFTAGVHRLWSHRSYKAKLPFRIFLGIGQTLSGEMSIFQWARDHRVHHKYSETNADPHNTGKGLFFAHIGWLLVKKHPSVSEKGKTLDISDLEKDPVVRIQKRFYLPLAILVGFVLPTVLPYLLWNESFLNAYFICGMLRYLVTLHSSWMVNSLAHRYGQRPYDKNIDASENMLVSLMMSGEGFHNYHHTFAIDYRASEHGWKVNLATVLIDVMAYIGQVYDRKTVPAHVVKKRMLRTGCSASNDEH